MQNNKNDIGFKQCNCKITHHMKVEPMSNMEPNAVIVIENPSFYCAKCRSTFGDESIFLYVVLKQSTL